MENEILSALYNKDMTERISYCLYCGKELRTPEKYRYTKKYCSPRCQGLHKSPFKSTEVQKKAKNTLIEKYGKPCGYQKPEVIKKARKAQFEKYGCYAFNSGKEKETWLKKYGVDNPQKNEQVRKKTLDTIIKSGWSSKEEEQVYSLLKKKYKVVKRNYFCKRYPFPCDFYIPEIDLFIEGQFGPHHGFHPFNPNSREDQNTLQHWIKRKDELSKKGKGQTYKNWIRHWTERDPLKREYARKNNLNYIELWNVEGLVGTLSRWNPGKKAEEHDRVKHDV